jgi:hypothetical protein
MPFKSQAQRAYMYAKHPELAKEFEAATPKGKKLPKHVKKKKPHRGKKGGR